MQLVLSIANIKNTYHKQYNSGARIKKYKLLKLIKLNYCQFEKELVKVLRLIIAVTN